MDVRTAEKPIFLLGTGRCGSTYWQTILCAANGVWVWGEHEGILASFSTMVSALDKNSQLSQWSLDLNKVILTPDISPGDATRFAWNNGFDKEILLRHTANFISRLFKENLPRGKSRWGFKEIRYGGGSYVPEFLLELFPEGKVVITSRYARETIISSLVAWHKNEIELYLSGHTSRLVELIDEYANKWINFGRFAFDLKKKYPNNVGFTLLEQENSLNNVLNFLDLDYTESMHKFASMSVNKNKNVDKFINNENFAALIDMVLLKNSIAIENITSELTGLCQEYCSVLGDATVGSGNITQGSYSE